MFYHCMIYTPVNYVTLTCTLVIHISQVNWLYRLFMDQACVFENQYQYTKSNTVITDVITRLLQDGLINQKTKDVIETFQSKMSGKERYLAFWIRKSVCMTYDAMTTTPVESMNRNMKHKSKVSPLYMNYISCYFPLIISICTICTLNSIFLIHILYIQIVL
jgi:hypothetical protein